MIHFVKLDPETTIPVLMDAKPADMTLLELEAAILAHWAIRWASATPHERQKIMDSLRITLQEVPTNKQQ